MPSHLTTSPWLRRLGASPFGEALSLSGLPERLTAPPALGTPPFAVADPAGPSSRKALRLARQRATERLQQHWLFRMAFGPTPIVDRLAQLWLGVFPVSVRQVRDPLLLWRQTATIRARQGRRYGDLLLAMVLDPAVQTSLDGFRSQSGNPNENLARELMELFSLGEGNFGEKDVQEAARALSGYRMGPDGIAQLQPHLHDDGEKTILGVRDRFDAHRLVQLLVRQEATAYTISRRLWRQLVGPLPSRERSMALAQEWQRSNLDLPWLYRSLLETPEARQSMAIGGMIRDPIDLVVASLALLGSRHPDALRASRLHLQRMGQNLFQPSSVKGWPVDRDWLSLRGLTARRRGLQVLLSDAEVWESRRTPETIGLDLVPRQPLGLRLPAPADQAHLAALWNDPVWQLK